MKQKYRPEFILYVWPDGRIKKQGGLLADKLIVCVLSKGKQNKYSKHKNIHHKMRKIKIH